MKKFVVIMIVSLVVLVGLMIYGESTCVAETAVDFESLADCMEKMGYVSIELSEEIMKEYLSNDDIDGYINYVRQIVGLADDEDMMLLSINGDYTFPAAGLVYPIEDKGLHMENRTILRVVKIDLV